MVKQNNINKTITKKKSIKSQRKKNTIKEKVALIHTTKFKVSFFCVFALGVFLIFASYAWFSTTLNVKINNFNMVVQQNSGLSISLDGVNYDTFVEISQDTLLDGLTPTYPNHSSHWSYNGLIPVSSNGITNHNSPVFNMFSAGNGVSYDRKDRTRGFITTYQLEENGPRTFSSYTAFDLFFKNVTGSPVSDNLYLDYGTQITLDENANEEMQGLFNSLRIGIVKIGSLPKDASPRDVQNIRCNNNCESIIYEPNSTAHTSLSIERAKKYGVNLVDGERFPTFAFSKAGGPIYVDNTVSGSPNLDMEYFTLQNTITENDFEEPLFSLPDGVTKVRVYLWVEGQDIDSLETDSEGASISLTISFVKDTEGYNAFE